MNIFGEQLRTRAETDQRLFETSMSDLADVVVKSRPAQSISWDFDADRSENAIKEIFAYLHIKAPEVPQSVKRLSERLEYMLRPSGVMKRKVRLPDGWWKDAVGAMLAQTVDGEIVALLPHGRIYRYTDPDTGRRVKINKKSAKLLTGNAYCFYKPFPQKKLTIVDLVVFIARTLSPSDYAMIVLSTMAITLVGLFTPYATQQLFSGVIPLERMGLVAPIACMLLGSVVATNLFLLNDMVLTTGIENKMDLQVHSAAMARLLSLPAEFFRGYSAGELSSRLENISELCKKLRDAVLGSGLTALFSFVYIFQMSLFAPSLTWAAFLLMLLNVAFSLVSAWMQINYERKRLDSNAKLRGLSFALYSGIQKIKLAGAEKRMFARWAASYRDKSELDYRPPALIRLASVINKGLEFGGLMILYAIAASNGVGVASYLAFYSAYGMASSAIMKLAGIVDTIADIKPMLEMVEPIMKEQPETGDNTRIVAKLDGDLSLSHVTFRYEPDGPAILDDLSLHIKKGEYVAIVGKTGCGKSTLLRILLGFETPQKGAVYYDGRDLKDLDIRSVRRNIGVVLQDGKLFAGDIFANISVSAPEITREEAMEAAQVAGVKKDIERMPMGLSTLISEGSGGISGGQKQRLMIARAIAPKPSVLMFDEATSALDNITQKQVSDALDKLECTRIVIAHRLSTIRHCDRILLLDSGRIAESGTFDELVGMGGGFAELVKRQML